MADTSAKPYLDYLKTEMTIMGVLSAFSVAVAGVVLDKESGGKTTGSFADTWASYAVLWLISACGWMLAALAFYRQRSLLAYYYGQLALTELEDRPSWVLSRAKLLYECDSWETWRWYRTGFTAMAGAAAVMISITILVCANSTNRSSVHDATLFWLPIVIVAIILFGLLQWYVMTKYWDDEDPWSAFFARQEPSVSTEGQTQITITQISSDTWLAAHDEAPAENYDSSPEAALAGLLAKVAVASKSSNS
jgi:hypothetical protein